MRNCGIESDLRTINQGTVLGPLIYLLYVNDIRNSNVKSDVIMFADDTAIIATQICYHKQTTQICYFAV